MMFRVPRPFLLSLITFLSIATLPTHTRAQTPSSSNSPKHIRKPSASADSSLDLGTVRNNVYRNKTLAFACKIPEGWVLRTDEMNDRDQQDRDQQVPDQESAKADSTPSLAASSAGAKVLLAAFSRPP
jgi:hypothetical protein